MPNLAKIVQPGDLLFVRAENFVSKAIQKITFGTVNHVGVVYDSKQIFETDIAWGKASLRDLAKYDKAITLIMRCKDINPNRVKALCIKYDGTPYSWWDIWNNFALALLKDEVRKKLLEILGTKKYAICSELSARIIYEATSLGVLKNFEGLTPQDLLSITLSSPDFQLVQDLISPILHPEE